MFLTHLSILLSQALLIFLRFVVLLQNSLVLVLYFLGAALTAVLLVLLLATEWKAFITFLLLFEKKVVILMNLSLSSF